MPGKARKEEALKKLHWFVIPAVFIADRLLKIWALHSLSESHSVPLWPGVMHLTRVNNTGAAFGLWHDSPMALAVFSAFSVVLISAYLAGRFGPVSQGAAWALVAGGALGNLYDRVFFGYVIDYLDFRVWPVFNFADVCISCGVAWIVFCFIRKPGNKSHASRPF